MSIVAGCRQVLPSLPTTFADRREEGGAPRCPPTVRRHDDVAA